MFKLVEDEKDDRTLEKEAQDSLIGGDIYFDRDPTGLIGAQLSDTIRKMNGNTQGYLLMDQDPALYINNPNVSARIYERLLNLYINNHKILIGASPRSMDSIINLESWFIRVIEPIPEQSSMTYSEWRTEVEGRRRRERFKMNGYTYYCDESMRRKIKPKMQRDVLIQVKDNQKYIQ
jgi:hypothetical protein